MKGRFTILIVSIFLLTGVFETGCASSYKQHKPHGKLNPKKPIPCPGKPKCR